MISALFGYSDYRKYIADSLSRQPAQRGIKSRMAKAAGCHLAFVSQVLKGQVHFTQEHALGISDFFGHTEEESRYFLLLVLASKAGTVALRTFFNKQIEEIKKKQLNIAARIEADKIISSEDQLAYYSSWLYVAIHILTSIPQFQSRDQIARHLNLSLKQIAAPLQFLIEKNLVSESLQGKLAIRNARVHIAKDSKLLSKHHTNWRIRAIQSLDHEDDRNVHFSTVYSLSREDVFEVSKMIVNFISTLEPVFMNSAEEVAYCFNVDFFSV